MRKYPVLFPRFYRYTLPGGLFRLREEQKTLYLTFDDGPTTDITQKTLEILDDYKAPSTFFLIGKNIDQNPEIVEEIKKRGHVIGSHTQNHANGWKTSLPDYLNEVDTAASKVPSRLFRPPYGRIRWKQASQLQKNGLTLVMWDVISGDFDLTLSGDECADLVKKNARPGSIVVFHDSVKAWPRLSVALPKVLEHFSEMGYVFKALPDGHPAISSS